MSQLGLSMLWAESPRSLGDVRPAEATVITANPTPANIIPIPILTGADGSLPFLARAPNETTDIGVKATTKKGLNCWKSDVVALNDAGIFIRKVVICEPPQEVVLLNIHYL